MARGDDPSSVVKAPKRRSSQAGSDSKDSADSSTKARKRKPNRTESGPKDPADTLAAETRRQALVERARAKRAKALARGRDFERKLVDKSREAVKEEKKAKGPEAKDTNVINERRTNERRIKKAGKQHIHLDTEQTGILATGGKLAFNQGLGKGEVYYIQADDLLTSDGDPFDIRRLFSTETSPAEVAFVGDIALTAE